MISQITQLSHPATPVCLVLAADGKLSNLPSVKDVEMSRKVGRLAHGARFSFPLQPAGHIDRKVVPATFGLLRFSEELERNGAEKFRRRLLHKVVLLLLLERRLRRASGKLLRVHALAAPGRSSPNPSSHSFPSSPVLFGPNNQD